MRAIGIGDLHFDGRLAKHIPDLNGVILGEVAKCHDYAQREGIKNVFYYGDVSDVPTLSADATCQLLDMFQATPDMKHFFITGNHDFESEGKHSLSVLEKLCSIGRLDNVRIMPKPTLLRFKDAAVNFLPWPHFSTRADALNVIHVETNGSKWEVGKPIVSERDTEAHCVGGHLHTAQTVGPNKNIHYSGTLYQTNFGEKYNKFFHDMRWNGIDLEVEKIPNAAQYELINLIVASPKDLDRIQPNPKKLYKVFVKAGVDLNAATFDTFPNVVKINTFSNREELQNLIAEELVVSDANATVNSLTVMEALETYLTRAGNKMDPAVVTRAQSLYKKMLGVK
jgi:DNA repair exonuclease SbcCD nuclease subunit